MAKTKIVQFMCSIVLAVSLVLSQSYTAMASGSSTITEQQLGVLFDGMPYRYLYEMFSKFPAIIPQGLHHQIPHTMPV